MKITDQNDKDFLEACEKYKENAKARSKFHLQLAVNEMKFAYAGNDGDKVKKPTSNTMLHEADAKGFIEGSNDYMNICNYIDSIIATLLKR